MPVQMRFTLDQNVLKLLRKRKTSIV